MNSREMKGCIIKDGKVFFFYFWGVVVNVIFFLDPETKEPMKITKAIMKIK